MKFTKQQRALLSAVMRDLGRRGGLATAANMTPEQRRARSSKALQARASKARERMAQNA
jgi:hypothetical protein